MNISSIASKLFRVGEGSAVHELVSEIESTANGAGLTLSRWQANKGSRATTVSYAIHSGERAAQFRLQPEGEIIASCQMGQLEGTTERCEAYRKLNAMRRQLDAHLSQSA